MQSPLQIVKFDFDAKLENIIVEYVSKKNVSLSSAVKIFFSFSTVKQFFDRIDDFLKILQVEITGWAGEPYKPWYNNYKWSTDDKGYWVSFEMTKEILKPTNLSILINCSLDIKKMTEMYPEISEFITPLSIKSTKSIQIYKNGLPESQVQDFSILVDNKERLTLVNVDISPNDLMPKTKNELFLSEIYTCWSGGKAHSYFSIDVEKFTVTKWQFPNLTNNKKLELALSTTIEAVDTKKNKTCEVLPLDILDKNRLYFHFEVDSNRASESKMEIRFLFFDPTIARLRQVFAGLNDVQKFIQYRDNLDIILNNSSLELYCGDFWPILVNLLQNSKDYQLDCLNQKISEEIFFLNSNYPQYFVNYSNANPYVAQTGYNLAPRDLLHVYRYTIKRQPSQHITPIFTSGGKISKNKFSDLLYQQNKVFFKNPNGIVAINADKSMVDLNKTKYHFWNLDINDIYNHFQINDARTNDLYNLFVNIGSNELMKFPDKSLQRVNNLGITFSKNKEERVSPFSNFFPDKNQETISEEQVGQFDMKQNTSALLQIILADLFNNEFKYLNFDFVFSGLKDPKDAPNSIKCLINYFYDNGAIDQNIDIFRDEQGFVKYNLFPLLFIKFLLCFRIEVIQDGTWVDLSREILDTISPINNLFCRLSYYENTNILPKVFLDKFKLPMFNNYFVIQNANI